MCILATVKCVVNMSDQMSSLVPPNSKVDWRIILNV